MKPYTFILTRTYETSIEIDAENYDEAVKKLSEVDVYALELEQCCCVEESVSHEGIPVKDY
jgi:hypothetical protein